MVVATKRPVAGSRSDSTSTTSRREPGVPLLTKRPPAPRKIVCLGIETPVNVTSAPRANQFKAILASKAPALDLFAAIFAMSDFRHNPFSGGVNPAETPRPSRRHHH